MSKRQVNISAQLRKAIEQAERRGITRYAIAKQTGLSQGMLSRFMGGENTPKLETAERIAKAIGLRLALSKDS